MDVGLEGRRTQSDKVDTRSRMRGQHTQNDHSGLQGSRELGTEQRRWMPHRWMHRDRPPRRPGEACQARVP